ncbi:hypothetical protein V9T40_008592 [Parthenolecanium corni]|uniref:Uncharacterized protein n=1 Tax=Parthenolecanium corni TaxID=536013 RepID=A0AAN9TND7_9HEMI
MLRRGRRSPTADSDRTERRESVRTGKDKEQGDLMDERGSVEGRQALLILTAKSEMARIPWARLIRPWASHRDVTQGWPDVAL